MLFLAPLLLVLSTTFVLAIPLNGTDHSSSKLPTVTIKNGTVQGLHLPAFNEDIFLSIPFAAPPVGDLRFQHPKSYNSTWKGVLKATAYGPSCPVYGGFAEGFHLDEDCLTLDVVRPAGADWKELLPVMVWIYGGGELICMREFKKLALTSVGIGFTAGTSSDPRFNLSYIVNASVAIDKPVIAVGINYRVAGFGFLAGQDVFNSGNSNAGLYDQRLALRWLQENVASFGGDPMKVTIWGESAGAFSVGYHLIANNGNNEGLFRAAIMESGANIGPTRK